MKNILVLFVGTLFLVSCSKSNSAASSSARVKVASMTSTSGSRRAMELARGSVSSKLVASKTHFGYAVVDGARYHLTKINGEDATSDNMTTSISMEKDLLMTGDSSQSVVLNEAVSWVEGKYRGISLHFKNSWDVKAHCRTMKTGGSNTGYLVYTTASGIQVKDCSAGGVDCTTLPDTYDFYTYSTLNTYSGYVSANDYQQETHLNFEVKATDSPIISILYDGSYGVTCWDGQTSYDTSTAFGGFAGMTDTTHTTYYGATTPVFTTFYLPVFGYVTTDANEAVPTARTFLASWAQPSTGSDLDTSLSNFTFKPLTVMTLVYNAAGNIIAGSTRNYQGNGSDNPFDLDLEGFATSTTGTGTDFYGSGWYYKGGSDAPTFIRNKQIVAFNPATTVGNLFSSVYKDASGCGQTLTDFQGNNPSRACFSGGTTQGTVWFKEMTR